MRKLISVMAVMALVCFFTVSCGDDDEPQINDGTTSGGGSTDGGTTQPASYAFLYQTVFTKDILKAVDVEIEILNPITGKTKKDTIYSVSENMFGQSGSSLVELAMPANANQFVYYNKFDGGIDLGMSYQASCRYLYNPTKANSLPEGIYNASRPRVNTCLMDVANEKLFKSYSFTSGIEVSRDKFLEYINSETRNHVEINGTVSAE